MYRQTPFLTLLSCTVSYSLLLSHIFLVPIVASPFQSASCLLISRIFVLRLSSFMPGRQAILSPVTENPLVVIDTDHICLGKSQTLLPTLVLYLSTLLQFVPIFLVAFAKLSKPYSLHNYDSPTPSMTPHTAPDSSASKSSATYIVVS